MGRIKESLKYLVKSAHYALWKINRPRGRTAKEIKSVLIANGAFIGDLLATTPLISILSRAGKKIDMAVIPEMAQIFKNNRLVRKILLIKDGKIAGNLKGYDASILIYPSSTEIASQLAKAEIPIRLAYVPHVFLKGYTKQFTGLLFVSEKGLHKARQHSKFLRFLGAKEQIITPEKNPLVFPIPKSEVSNARRKFNLPLNYAVVSAGSRGQRIIGTKFPKPSAFIKIVNHIIDKCKLSVVFVGSREDSAYYPKIMPGISKKKKIVNTSGKTTILESAAIIKKAKFLVGIDSGAVHIAASQGVPLIDMIRKGEQIVWSPWAKKPMYKMIVSPDKHLDRISPEEVIKAIDLLLKEKI